MSSRKIPRELENPIDNILYDISDMANPFFYKLGLTPNHLTLISFIFTLVSAYLFTQNRYSLSAVAYFFSFLFDCMDGNYARQYKMTSDFGDLFDHITDHINTFLFFYLLYTKYWHSKSRFMFIIMIVLVISVLIQISCEEIYCGKESPTSNLIKKVCPITTKEDATKVMRFSRFIGCGTSVFYTIFLIYFSQYLV